MKTVLSLDDKNNALTKIFASEQHRFLNNRARYEVTHLKGTSTICVEAEDATALRAVLNSICKILIVTEKAKQVTEHETRRSSATTSAQ